MINQLSKQQKEHEDSIPRGGLPGQRNTFAMAGHNQFS